MTSLVLFFLNLIFLYFLLRIVIKNKSIKKSYNEISFEKIINQLPGHIYWKNQQGIMLHCNAQNLKDFGLSSLSEYVGKTDFDLFPKEQAVKLRESDKKVMDSGVPIVVEEESTRADGSIGLYLSHKLPLKNENNDTIGILGVSLDITDARKKEINRLKFLENIIALMPGHVFWKDKNGVFLGCNDQQAKTLGLASRHEVIGKNTFEMTWSGLPEGERRKQASIIDSNDRRIMKNGITETIEEPLFRQDGSTAAYLSTKSPLHDEDGKIIGILGFAVDITAQKEAEALKFKLEHEAHERQVNTVKTLAATIAHELRTPLAAIYSGAEGTKDYLPDLIKAYQFAKEKEFSVRNISPSQLNLIASAMDDIIAETRYSNLIINMLVTNVDQQGIKQGEFQVCSIAHCVNEALQNYPFQPAERNLVRWDKKLDFNFMGKEMLTIHILFNLLKNAIYYIRDAGKGDIHIWVEPSEKNNKLHFHDTGKGIAADILPKIFDLFFSKTFHGSGIGLAFCKLVMQSYGGKIECESVEGEFTEFTLTFPLCKDKS